MRGSPLFRTLLLALGLVLAGLGMLRFGAAREEAPDTSPANTGPVVLAKCGFAMKLSDPGATVDLKGREGRSLFHGDSGDPLNGMIDLDSHDPVVFVTIHWADTATAGGTRFAKLSLEPAGKPTAVHYFESAGDIEDVWELPAE